MFRAIEAVIDEQDTVRLLESVHFPAIRRALVVILDDELPASESETTYLSEAALAVDQNRPEEDAAWEHLQPEE
jgi:hypothetical protein